MRVSIVMPVYNEAAVIAGVLEELDRDVASRLPEVEIVMVNDGSTDDTREILDRLAAADSRLVVHHAAANRGHGPTLRRALEASTGDWIFQIDSDGQQVAAEFWELWAHRDEADLVMGVRTRRRGGPHRRMVSAAARAAIRALAGGELRDVNVPFKLIRRAVWNDLAPAIPPSPVAPSLLLAMGASVRGWRVAQVPISHKAREHAPSTVDLRALVRLSAGALREAIGFRRRLARRTPRPTRVVESAASVASDS